MAKSSAKPRTNLTEEELYEIEKQEFETGPLSVLTNAVKNNTQVRYFSIKLIVHFVTSIFLT